MLPHISCQAWENQVRIHAVARACDVHTHRHKRTTNNSRGPHAPPTWACTGRSPSWQHQVPLATSCAGVHVYTTASPLFSRAMLRRHHTATPTTKLPAVIQQPASLSHHFATRHCSYLGTRRTPFDCGWTHGWANGISRKDGDGPGMPQPETRLDGVGSFRHVAKRRATHRRTRQNAAEGVPAFRYRYRRTKTMQDIHNMKAIPCKQRRCNGTPVFAHSFGCIHQHS